MCFEFCAQVVFEHFDPKGMKVFMLSVFCCSNLSKIEMRPQTSVRFKTCALVGFDLAYNGGFLPTFRDCLTLAEGTDRIS